MKTKHLESVGATLYHAPETEIVDFLVKQSVMAASNGILFDGNGPEGYDVDKDEFSW